MSKSPRPGRVFRITASAESKSAQYKQARYQPASAIGRTSKLRIDAIVGLDVLARTGFSIDYRKRVLRFTPGDQASQSPLSNSCWPFVTVRMTIAGQHVRLLVDTGSSDLVLFKSRMPAALSGAPW